MNSSRLEAFSDGIFGIALTLMAIEIQVPEGHSYLDLITTDSAYFIAYVLSFICIAIYWMSHHHLFQAAEKIDGRVLWANNIFLFFITLIPFSTGWIAESHFARDPVVLYGIIFIASGLTFLGLTNSLIRVTGKDSAFARVVRRDKRGLISTSINFLAIGVAFWNPIVAYVMFFLALSIWIIPSKDIEKMLGE